MKKKALILICILLTLICAAATADVAVNEDNFPDGNFREYVRARFDKSGDGILSDAEIAGATLISCQGKSIRTLKGVQYFTKLTTLYCNGNQLTSLDVSQCTQLTELYCGKNKLTSLDLSRNTHLRLVHCQTNKLTSLNVRNCTALTELNCDSNPLTSLYLKDNKNLKTLVCGNVKLKTLDLTCNTKLTKVLCEQWCYGYNDLTKIDIRNCTYLNEVVRYGKYGSILADLFPDQVAYCHWLHGWFTDQNNDEKLDNGTDRCLLVADSTQVVTNHGSIYGKDSGKHAFASVNGLKYKLDLQKNTAVFTGPEDRDISTVEIPSEIEENGKTYKVTEIGTGACKGLKKLETVMIGKNIGRIGQKAFNGCEKLTTITLKTTKLKLSRVGKDAFKKINKKAVFRCPKKMRKSYKSILRKRGAPGTAKFK